MHALRTQHARDVDSVEQKHAGQMSALENGYEAKLGDGMARYKTIHQSIERMRMTPLRSWARRRRGTRRS